MSLPAGRVWPDPSTRLAGSVQMDWVPGVQGSEIPRPRTSHGPCSCPRRVTRPAQQRRGAICTIALPETIRALVRRAASRCGCDAEDHEALGVLEELDFRVFAGVVLLMPPSVEAAQAACRLIRCGRGFGAELIAMGESLSMQRTALRFEADRFVSMASTTCSLEIEAGVRAAFRAYGEPITRGGLTLDPVGRRV
jgi:hypothetical protein